MSRITVIGGIPDPKEKRIYSLPRRRMKLLLIEPYPPDNRYKLSPLERKILWFPKLSMPVLAAHTPEDWEISFIDESVDRVDFRRIVREGVDLIGISAQMTCYAPRAYQLSQQFREMGIKTVIGGTHVTYCEEEAARYCDVVVSGEADELWPIVCEDARSGTLQKFYRMKDFPNLSQPPMARTDFFSPSEYMTGDCIQTTRGCHFECEFCSVSPFNGKQSRRRNISNIVQEILQMKERRQKFYHDRINNGSLGQRFQASLAKFLGLADRTIIAFVDDLHNSNRDFCKKLWEALKPLNIRWGAQCTLFLGNEPDMVQMAADAGCVSMFVGMESIIPGSIHEMNKPFNKIHEYEQQIKCFHDHGIMVNPGIIFGSDHEDESVFPRTVEFLIKNKVELAYFNIATPLPGTELFKRMEADGRIFDRYWGHYDGKHVVFYPKNMSVEALEEGFFWANQEFFSWRSIFQRIRGTSNRRIPRIVMNYAFRHLIYRTTPPGAVTPSGMDIVEILKKWEGLFKDLKLTLQIEKQALLVAFEFSKVRWIQRKATLRLAKWMIKYSRKHALDIHFRDLRKSQMRYLEIVLRRLDPAIHFSRLDGTFVISTSR